MQVIARVVSLLILLAAKFAPTSGAETLAWIQPQSAGGYSMIPNETREFFVRQANYKTVGASFSVSGGTLVSALNGMVTVQAPASGSKCSYDATNKVVVSDTEITITATP